MASLMEELIDVLEQEYGHYSALVELSREKTPIVIAGDIRALQDLTEREKEITDRIQNLENKREEVVKDIAIVINKDVALLTVKNLVQMLGNRPEEQEKLSDLQGRLRETIQELVRINDQNRMLIEQSMDMIAFDLELFKSLRQAPETANYNRHAYNTGALLGNRGFDAKQ